MQNNSSGFSCEDYSLDKSGMGFLEVKKINPAGEIVQVVYVKNVITFTATNIMARSLGGDATYNPTHIIVGGSLIPVAPIAVSRSDIELSTLTNDDPITGGDPVNNARELIPVSSPGFTGISTAGAPTGQQNNNVVTFTGVMPAFPTNPNLDGKKFYEAGIITKIGTSELLFSHQFHAPVEKLAGFQLVYTWSIRLQ